MPPRKVRGTLMTRAHGQETTRNIKARLSHNGKLSPKVPSPTIPVAARNGGITARAMAEKSTIGVYTRAKRVMKASLFVLFLSALATFAIILDTVL